jgi:CHAT domain-containing protein
LGNILYDQDGVPGYLHSIVLAEIGVLGSVLDEIWPMLREEIMAPLAASLQELGHREAVLIPVGTLSLLSLHSVVLDQIVFTYAPSARALQSVQADTNAVGVTPSLLGIGNPTGFGQQPLAFARLEVEEIAALFAEQGYQYLTLYETSATRDDIAVCFPGATHLHFSCHGRFEASNPLDSALYLAGDDMLTLDDLLDGGLDVSTARMAVLSACQTGITDFRNVPDEAVGFPAGFIQAGVPGVISTLWPINDVSTAVLLRQFYQYHLEEGLEPAIALNKAQGWLRDATAGEMKLADYYERLYQASGRQDKDALKGMRYCRSRPDVKPFAHPYYWAGFTFTGV